MNRGVRAVYGLSAAAAVAMIFVTLIDLLTDNAMHSASEQNMAAQDDHVTNKIRGNTSRDAVPETADPDNWKTIIPKVLYVYSAFVNIRLVNLAEISVLGALRQDYFRNPNLLELRCKIWIIRRDRSPPEVYVSNVINVTSSFVRKTLLHSAEFICRFSLSPLDLDDVVISLIAANSTSSSNGMRLHNNINKRPLHNFTVCLGRPLYGEVPENRLLEWLELNKVFGAEQIMLHNDSFSSAFDPYLRHYVKVGLVEILPWYFPAEHGSIAPDLLSYYLQQTMLMDCLYRYRHLTKYLVVCDLDELIVPRHPADYTWTEMILRANCSERVNGFGARHMLFSEQYIQETSHRRERTMFEMTTRTTIVSKYFKRAKYIANTLYTTALSIHNIVSGIGVNECVMDIGVGALHHYRKTIPSSRFKVNERNPVIVDKTLFKYKKTIEQSVNRVKQLVHYH